MNHQLLIPRRRSASSPYGTMYGVLSHYKLEEASSTRNDSYAARHLTDNNTVTQAVGKVGSAGQFTAANDEYLSLAHDSAGAFEFGDTDFWGAAWVYADSLSGVNGVMQKGTTGFTMYALGGAMYVQVNAAAASVAFADTATWAFFMWYHDAVTNLIGISKNGGAFATAAHATGMPAGSDPFYVGRYGAGSVWNGRIDEVTIAGAPAAGIAAKADEIRDYLHNGGSGVAAPW